VVVYRNPFLITPHIVAQDHAAKIQEFLEVAHKYRQFNGSVLVAENGKKTPARESRSESESSNTDYTDLGIDLHGSITIV